MKKVRLNDIRKDFFSISKTPPVLPFLAEQALKGRSKVPFRGFLPAGGQVGVVFIIVLIKPKSLSDNTNQKLK